MGAAYPFGTTSVAGVTNATVYAGACRRRASPGSHRLRVQPDDRRGGLDPMRYYGRLNYEEVCPWHRTFHLTLCRHLTGKSLRMRSTRPSERSSSATI